MLKRLVLLLASMAVLCGSAAAEWTRVGEASGTLGAGRYAAYVDVATRFKAGDTARIWSIFDYKDPQKGLDGKPYRSNKLHWEFDCKDKLSRLAHLTWFVGQMGSGSIVYSSDGHPTRWSTWAPVSSDKALKIIWEIACEKK